TTDWEKHKLWNDDPVMLPFKSAARTGRFAGYEGPSNRKAAEVLTKYILTDMYAKAVQGMPPADAVKAAHAELVEMSTGKGRAGKAAGGRSRRFASAFFQKKNGGRRPPLPTLLFVVASLLAMTVVPLRPWRK